MTSFKIVALGWFTVRFSVMTLSQPAALASVAVYVPDVASDCPLKPYVFGEQIVWLIVEALGWFTVKFNVMTLSQPAAFVSVAVYVPDVVSDCPLKL
jgi:hypothetical protein